MLSSVSNINEFQRLRSLSTYKEVSMGCYNILHMYFWLSKKLLYLRNNNLDTPLNLLILFIQLITKKIMLIDFSGALF